MAGPNILLGIDTSTADISSGSRIATEDRDTRSATYIARGESIPISAILVVLFIP
jgi:hypothetical protein